MHDRQSVSLDSLRARRGDDAAGHVFCGLIVGAVVLAFLKVGAVGVDVVAELTAPRDRPDAKYFVGGGKVDELVDTVEATTDTATCEDTAALFVSAGSVNAQLADPFVAATCEGDELVISSNGIPDYTYIQTSPGDPAAPQPARSRA